MDSSARDALAGYRPRRLSPSHLLAPTASRYWHQPTTPPHHHSAAHAHAPLTTARTPPGLVSLAQYYEDLSASIDDDDYFCTMVVAAWPNLFDPKIMGNEAIPRPVPKRQIDKVEQMLLQVRRLNPTLVQPDEPPMSPR